MAFAGLRAIQIIRCAILCRTDGVDKVSTISQPVEDRYCGMSMNYHFVLERLCQEADKPKRTSYMMNTDLISILQPI